MSRRSSARIIAATAASVLLLTCAAVAVAAQGKEQEDRPPADAAERFRHRGAQGKKSEDRPPSATGAKKPNQKPGVVFGLEKATAAVDAMIAEFDLTRRPVPAIPDNPPPHERALFDLTYVVEPPDLILVEVLEALPGRPISGERLVRPDGTISLGFYGDVYVRGLTLPQVKVAIIKQIRKLISDETLGLITLDVDSLGIDPQEPVHPQKPAEGRKPPPIPDLPGDRNPFDLNQGDAAGAMKSRSCPA